ncbi:DUF3592 domain-containing protein [Massilia rubra]|uniref:DUF3592 domain-containing protein n=1 Tax=Massilia rubra TaxID=2607910 RepID=A0ABX0LX78_9BURK|nr:DUF3592 domain-containing protein [Massilia rubra]NHZ36737.1 DUF3592 domain-containing protein [Massilia rubra]
MSMMSGLIPTKTSTGSLIWGMVVFCASVCLFLFGYSSIKDRIEFIKSTSRANGVVISKESGKYHAHIRFSTEKGEIVNYTQHGYTSFEVGEKVSILYYAHDPHKDPGADAFGSLWGGSIMLFGLGLLTLFFSWLSIFKPEYVT